jgi:hypothetical protein
MIKCNHLSTGNYYLITLKKEIGIVVLIEREDDKVLFGKVFHVTGGPECSLGRHIKVGDMIEICITSGIPKTPTFLLDEDELDIFSIIS